MADFQVLAERLALLRAINGYSMDGMAQKDQLHRSGKGFLRQLARSLGLPPEDYDLRSNRGGMAVSGEVTLHTNRLYVQLAESMVGGSGVSVLYRSCQGRADYCGGQNHYLSMHKLANGGLPAFLAQCAAMQGLTPARAAAPAP